MKPCDISYKRIQCTIYCYAHIVKGENHSEKTVLSGFSSHHFWGRGNEMKEGDV